MVVMDDSYRVFVANTRTGEVAADLKVSNQKWGLRLNGAGNISVDIPVHAEENSGINIRGLTRPIYQQLGVSYRGRVLECGPIWKRNYSNGTMSLEAEGLWSIFDRRKALAGALLSATGPGITSAKLVLTGSLRDIARELVRVSIQDNPYGVGGLNIALPPLEGGVHTRTYNGYELPWIGEELRALTGVENGPDLRFRPQFQDGDPMKVQHVLEGGTEAQPLLAQVGGDWVWDVGAQGSPVVDLDTEEDATEQAIRAWTPGAGQERAMKLAYATNQDLITRGMPWLEVDEKHDVEDLAVLQQHANQLRSETAAPVTIVGAQVRADHSPLLGEYQPGEWASFVIPEDHATLDPGVQRVRVMAVDGGTSEVVSLAVSPFIDPNESSLAVKTYTRSSAEGASPDTWSGLPAGTWSTLPSGTWNEVT